MEIKHKFENQTYRYFSKRRVFNLRNFISDET